MGSWALRMKRMWRNLKFVEYLRLYKSFLFALLSSFLIGGDSNLLDWHHGRSVKLLLAVRFTGLEGSVVDKFLEDHSGDGANDFVFFDNDGN